MSRIGSYEKHLKLFAEENKSEFGNLVKDKVQSISPPDKVCNSACCSSYHKNKWHLFLHISFILLVVQHFIYHMTISLL